MSTELTAAAFFEVGFFVVVFLDTTLGLDAAALAFVVDCPETAYCMYLGPRRYEK